MNSKLIDIKYIEMNCIRNIHDYHKVSHDRWQNALACYNNGDYFAALYLAGYSVECILKYVILESLFSGQKDLSLRQLAKQKAEYRCLKDHKLGKLIYLANQEKIFLIPKESDFKIVLEWLSEWRYATEHNINKGTAEDFLKSSAQISEQLKNELVGKLKIRAFRFVS